MPTTAENDTAIIITLGFTTTDIPRAAPPAVTRPTPIRMPIMPPQADRIADSVRNWISTSRVLAPSALRIPISRVRSVTDTSMIFMMPMPPTSREMAAIPPTAIDIPPIMVSTEVISCMAVYMYISSGSRPCILAA